MLIRVAMSIDAPAICDVLRRSITELCVDDDRNDPAILTAWLKNKTPGTVAEWIDSPADCVLVAEDAGTVLGVAAVTRTGTITLNYVSPDARFRGVTKALLHALETRAARDGNAKCALDSTQTARRFYIAAGYRATERATDRGVVPTVAMSKNLTERGVSQPPADSPGS